MGEEAWKAEARQVRGWIRRDQVDELLADVKDRYVRWQPSPEDYVKVAMVVGLVGLVIYAWAVKRGNVVSHG